MKKKDIDVVEKIEEEIIQKKKKIPKDVLNDINKEIFKIILVAIIVMIYFIFINLGYMNIEGNSYLTDLKVFSITSILLCITLFEKSYKEENGKVCIFGIEVLVIAIYTLLSIYIYIMQNSKFITITSLISLVFTIYYITKSIMIYKKMKKEYLKSLSDIGEIVKKEKPRKKEETSKRIKVEGEKQDKVKVKENKDEKKTSNKKDNKKTKKELKGNRKEEK